MAKNYSKTAIDRAGSTIIHIGDQEYDEKMLDSEYILDEFRAQHLKPLSEITIDIQNFMRTKDIKYYLAQRLKRKPQIIRKLKRFSVRLTQLQDIGGNRIIVQENKDVDKVLKFIKERYNENSETKIHRITDYREKGRDDSGYRSIHVVLNRDGKLFELQIRSKIQHFWAESIERTSVIYGYHLKELDGDPQVIAYFKNLSDSFYEIESGRELHHIQRSQLDEQRLAAEQLIGERKVELLKFEYDTSSVIKEIIEKEKHSLLEFNNWIIVFDWSEARFVTWDTVDQDAESASKKYIEYEKIYTSERKYEVVLIGSSDVSTIRETHSHYFGLQKFDSILASLDESIISVSSKLDLDFDAKKILGVMVRKKKWGQKAVADTTLKNHFCKNVKNFDSAIENLIECGFLQRYGNAVALNIKKKSEIEAVL